MDDELKGWLLEIIAGDEWNEDDLAGWAEEFMHDQYQGNRQADFEEQIKREMAKIPVLKPLVTEYKHDRLLPKLPHEANGALHGIGFIYDEDNDDRVLVAIEQLKDNRDIVALAEHEGGLNIYSRQPTGLSGMSICGDEWCVNEYVPYRGRWIEADREFIKNCVAQVLGYDRKPAAWEGESPSAKQVSYLRSLGYTGVEPATKSQAGALISEYKAKKVRFPG